jgi:hypothetical protein
MGHTLHVAEKSPSRSPGRTSSHGPIIMRQAALTSQGLLQPKADPCACGGSCPRCRGQLPIQKKLAISEPGDAYEREADRVADEVLAARAHPEVNGSLPRIQRFTAQVSGQAEAAPASVDSALASPGRPLEPALRQDMEQRFRYDFSQVRVHSGGAAEQSARDVNTKACTGGYDIVFGAGQFALGTHQGRQLIAHELTHVVQQSGAVGIRLDQSDEKRGLSPISPPISPPISALEKAAESDVRFRPKHAAYERDNATASKVNENSAIPEVAGNLATQRLLRSGVIQPKFAINQPGDLYEQEADRIAAHVTGMPEPGLQRTCAGCETGATVCPQCEKEKAQRGTRDSDHGDNVIAVTSQRIQEVEGEEDYIGEVLGTFEDPDCKAFFGASNCNPDNGDYEILPIGDPCCSKGCTRKHEGRHAFDLGLCCMMLNDNIRNRMGPREDLIERYNDWMKAGARNWSECNAYGVSVQCAKEEIKANNCARSDTQCCRELKFYLSEMGKQKIAYCDNAPTTRPPCPFRPSPGPTP